MKDNFDLLLNAYLLDDSKKIDVNANYYNGFINEAPKELYSIFSKKDYKIKASIGNGYRSNIPWLCIFDRSITTTATHGIYICFLFKKDMSGFYLTLMQGYTSFKKYGKEKKNYACTVSKCFQRDINTDIFSIDKISLEFDATLAEGYELCTIISKYYEKDKYTENELTKDLLSMKDIYNDLVNSFKGISYEQLVDNIVNNIDSYVVDEEERRLIEQELLKDSGNDEIVVRTLERVDFPNSRKKKESTRVVDKTVRKIDYIKKAKKSIDTGVQGELLVLDYEKERLSNLGYENLAKKVIWTANTDDSKGYDIESFEVDCHGKVKKIYIEVKTTEGNANNPFFLSKHEKEKIEELKEDYYIYRVFNITSDKPNFFVISYERFVNKLDINPELYKVEILN